ncbi:ABC transporter permease [Clostridium sp. D2Q-11]|uniref:ABC transporter permease n=1 Tax=Anaeromonas frigoriresistens TaxID=2683708 RepID=A0A942Z8A6_9FIRM|nr:ABC transporter permease [Anaeromonas frigoriresistens]MBS4537774.1 ABC transporter permease [Anaeromonas frigoriresistens]
MENKKKKNKYSVKQRLLSSNLTFTIVSVIIGLIIGAIVLLIAGFNPITAYSIIINGIFSRTKYISYMIIYATPLIITGLSVTFAFRTGLFNIGAEGQYIVGALVATIVGYFLELPIGLHAIVVFLAAIIAAAVWGGIAGFLKAKFGVHEVIATIMLNWIALYFSNYMVMKPFLRRPESDSSYEILDTASITILEDWKYTDAGREWLSQHPYIKDFLATPANLGFVIAILLAVLVWYILNKTTLGYELRAVGYNKHAAEYGGIKVKKSIITSMMIAGGLAGSAGALQVMGVTKGISVLPGMEGYGFDGIAVALIGGTTAFGNIFAGLLFGGLKYGGPKIQPPLGAPSEVVNIVIGTIVFFIAVPKFMRMIFNINTRKRGEKNAR